MSGIQAPDRRVRVNGVRFFAAHSFFLAARAQLQIWRSWITLVRQTLGLTQVSCMDYSARRSVEARFSDLFLQSKKLEGERGSPDEKPWCALRGGCLVAFRRSHRTCPEFLLVHRPGRGVLPHSVLPCRF